jgi:choline kinase
MKLNQYQGVKFGFDSLQENTNILNTIYRYIFNEDDYKSQKSEKRQLVNNNQYSVKSFKKSQ